MKPLADFVVRTVLAVNPVILPFAIMCGLVLAAVAVSLVALFRARALVRDATQGAKEDYERCTAVVGSLRLELTGLSAQFQDVRREAVPAAPPALPRPGLNLSKRSQALRMHRRGEAPAEIASALGIPLQEVDLLLKVHRIVISNI